MLWALALDIEINRVSTNSRLVSVVCVTLFILGHWIHNFFYNFLCQVETRYEYIGFVQVFVFLVLLIISGFTTYKVCFNSEDLGGRMVLVGIKNLILISSLCLLLFIFFYFFTLIALQELWKMYFISRKKLFLFFRCTIVCNFSSSFPQFSDSKGQMELK